MNVQGGMVYFGLNIIIILLCVAYCIFEPSLKRGERKFLLFSIMLGFSVMMAFRPMETKDTLNYIRYFNGIDFDMKYGFQFLRKYNGMEYGFLYLMLFVKTLCPDFRVFFFSIAFFNVSVSVSCLQRMTNYILLKYDRGNDLYGAVMLGYIAYVGVLHNGISIRMGLSLTLSFMSLDFFIRKKYKWMFFCGVLAFSFQRVCFVLFLAVIICKVFKKKNKIQFVYIWFLQLFFLIINIGLRFNEAIGEITKEIFFRIGIEGFGGYLVGFDNQVGLSDWFILLVIGVCIWFYLSEDHYRFFLNLVELGGWILVFLHDVRAISRMYDYLIVFFIPLLSARYYHGLYVKFNMTKVYILAVMVAVSILMLKLSFF